VVEEPPVAAVVGRRRRRSRRVSAVGDTTGLGMFTDRTMLDMLKAIKAAP